MSVATFLNPKSIRHRYINLDGKSSCYSARSGNGTTWNVYAGYKLLVKGLSASEVLNYVQEHSKTYLNAQKGTAVFPGLANSLSSRMGM